MMDADSKTEDQSEGRPSEITKDSIELSDEDYGGGLFNFKRPKDIRDGLGSGISNMLKGEESTCSLLVNFNFSKWNPVLL